jgi:hypothetical protein
LPLLPFIPLPSAAPGWSGAHDAQSVAAVITLSAMLRRNGAAAEGNGHSAKSGGYSTKSGGAAAVCGG